ncbi:hypothetical protein ABZ345_17700 [Lentzea sp. NPDC005914]|uniref:hypothetical protein n=1 Tax=Lentzea sp. NPDC005914 TaxID=3154572 RepID=UPI0033F153B2
MSMRAGGTASARGPLSVMSMMVLGCGVPEQVSGQHELAKSLQQQGLREFGVVPISSGRR